jgi:PQQ enzyme repeat
MAMSCAAATIAISCGGMVPGATRDGGREAVSTDSTFEVSGISDSGGDDAQADGAFEAPDVSESGDHDAQADVVSTQATLTERFVTDLRAACEFSSPVAITSRAHKEVLLVTADGTFTAIDPSTGAEVWRVSLPADVGSTPHLVAPPVMVETNRLVFAWQDVRSDWTRLNHHVGVLDLEARALDPRFSALTLTARKPTADGTGSVDFTPSHAYSRSAVAYARLPGHDLGVVYVSYGNIRDLQPWHGWIFEIDLDRWRGDGPAAAITSTLLTTADGDCGPENGDGARQMRCGGGVWAYMGPQILYDSHAPDGFMLLVPTGNGMLDPARGDFANSLLRTGHGLSFDPGCDPLMCDPFDILDPGEACMTSCRNLFIPRLLSGQSVPEGPNRACVGRTLLDCAAMLDWDLGASAPAVVALTGGPTVIVQPGKDGSVYLIDADHMGKLYDRLPIMAGCGEGEGSCLATWAGTIVTRPEIVILDGTVLVLIPTFVMDDVHPAGLQALEISSVGGNPHLIPRWQAPRFTDPESVRAFRNHPGGVTVVDVAGEPFAAIVDTAPAGQLATLYWVRVRDGAVVQRVTMAGQGQRFARPLAIDGNLYVPSCERAGSPAFNEGPSRLFAFTISAP